MDTEHQAWMEKEIEQLIHLHDVAHSSWPEIARTLGRTMESVRQKYRAIERDTNLSKRLVPVSASPYPQYNDPLVMEGDAFVMGDMELPYHNADFINRCIDLALKWGIRQMIAAGDTFHFDSLSSWEVQWQDRQIPPDLEDQITQFINSLPPEHQMRGHDIVTEYTINAQGNPSIGQEIEVINKAIKALESAFDRIDFIMGNHEGRLLRALKSPLFAGNLLSLVEADKKVWNIKPYYYSLLDSSGQIYQIEHPKSAAKSTADRLASKFQKHIIMGHSHILSFGFDVSGKYYAIHAGHGVDEARLAYAAQRHTNASAHTNGAVIVRDGFPYLLFEGIQWDRMAKL